MMCVLHLADEEQWHLFHTLTQEEEESIHSVNIHRQLYNKM